MKKGNGSELKRVRKNKVLSLETTWQQGGGLLFCYEFFCLHKTRSSFLVCTINSILAGTINNVFIMSFYVFIRLVLHLSFVQSIE